MSRTHYGFAVLALVALGTGTLYALSEPGAGNPPAYRLGVVERGDLSIGVSATGTLNPVVSVQVGSQLSGQVRDVYVDFNSPVRKGQLIARIDPSSFRLRVEQATADLEAARAHLKIQHAQYAAIRTDLARTKIGLAEAERELRRSESLHEKQFVAVAVRDKAQAGHDMAQEQVKSAYAQLDVGQAQLLSAEAVVRQRQAQLAQAKVDLERTEIRAPVDGIVVKKSVEPGQTVAASLQAPELFIIARDLREMQVEASIDEAEVNRVRVGQAARFTVDSMPGRAFEGAVHQVRKAPRMVQNVVTYVAVIRASNEELALFPGMTANVRILSKSHENVLKLPNAALRFQPPTNAQPDDLQAARTVRDGGTIWVLDSAGRPSPVSVRVGATDGVHTELVSGDAAQGMRVITGIHTPPNRQKIALRLKLDK